VPRNRVQRESDSMPASQFQLGQCRNVFWCRIYTTCGT